MDYYHDHGDFDDQRSLQDFYDSFSVYDYDSYESEIDDISYESDNDTDVDHLDSFHVIYNLSSEFHLDDIYRDNSADGNSSYSDCDSYDDSEDLVNIDCSGRSGRLYASENYFHTSCPMEYIRDTPVYDRSSKYKSNLFSESWRDKLIATADEFCHSLDNYSQFTTSSYLSEDDFGDTKEDKSLIFPTLSSVTSASISKNFSLSSKRSSVPARDYASGHCPVGKVKSLCAVWEARTKSAKKSAVISAKKGSQAPAASETRTADDAGTCSMNAEDQSKFSTGVVPSSELDTAACNNDSSDKRLLMELNSVSLPDSNDNVTCTEASVCGTNVSNPHRAMFDTHNRVAISESDINLTFTHYNESKTLSDVCILRDEMNYVLSKIARVTCKGNQCICMLFDQYVWSTNMVLLVINRCTSFYAKAYKFLFSSSYKHIWKFFDPGGYMSVYSTIIHHLANIFAIL